MKYPANCLKLNDLLFTNNKKSTNQQMSISAFYPLLGGVSHLLFIAGQASVKLSW